MRTLQGRDWQARIMGNGTHVDSGDSTYAPADFIGVTTDATAPDEDNTVLAGEIVAGTLIRARAVYSHTNGQATYVLTKTFTADDTVVIRKIGIFTAPTGGTMVFETALASPADLEPGDQVLITETVTI